MRAQIIDKGYGFMVKPLPFKTELERHQHNVNRQKHERKLCEMYDLDYNDILQKRGEKCLLGEVIA